MHSHSTSLHSLPVLQLFISDLEQLSDLGGRLTLRNAAAYAQSILDIVADHARELPSTMRALADVRSVVEHDADEARFRASVVKLRTVLEREHPDGLRDGAPDGVGDGLRVEGRAD